MITEQDIEDCKDEVSEEALEEALRDAECFHTSLVKAIACGEEYGVVIMIRECRKYVEDVRYKLAEKIAQEKDNARRFQADMKDKFE